MGCLPSYTIEATRLFVRRCTSAKRGIPRTTRDTAKIVWMKEKGMNSASLHPQSFTLHINDQYEELIGGYDCGARGLNSFDLHRMADWQLSTSYENVSVALKANTNGVHASGGWPCLRHRYADYSRGVRFCHRPCTRLITINFDVK